MYNKTISQFYEAVCRENEIKINPDLSEVLEKTRVTWNFALKLGGNNRLKRIQRLGDDDVLALSKCLLDNECVTGLDVSYNNIGDDGARHLAELLHVRNSALCSLDLTFNDIQAHGAEVLADSLQRNCSLLSLRLTGNKIGNVGAMHLARMLQVNRRLQEVELADCDLTTQSVIALSIVLKSNTALRSVDISRPLLFSLQDEPAVHFSEMLAVNCSLLELHLGKVGLTDTGTERLAEGLRVNHALRYLDLRCNHVSRDGARHLAEMLQRNTTLEVLDLSSNRIEDEGAAFLSDAIGGKGCGLKELSVCSNSVGTDGLLSLAQAVKSSQTLTHIYIWGNLLEEPVCQAFRELMASGRLPPKQTDVRAYEVDGHLFLAEVFQRVRRHLYCTDTTDNAAVQVPLQLDASALHGVGQPPSLLGRGGPPLQCQPSQRRHLRQSAEQRRQPGRAGRGAGRSQAEVQVLQGALQTTQSVIALSIVLKSNTALRSVDISRPLLFSLQDEPAVHFSEMLAVNCSLLELHLGKVGLTDTGTERLAEGLRVNHALRYLDLRCNHVSRDGARHLAEMLQRNTTLEVLDLSSNRIEDEGAAFLSDAIGGKGCGLKELSVCSNSVGTDGLLSLAQAVKSSQTLTHIYIWGNLLEEPVCQAFRELMASGRLPPKQTDVRAYEVDGHLFLAEVFQRVRRHLYCTDTTDNAAVSTDPTTLQVRDLQPAPLQVRDLQPAPLQVRDLQPAPLQVRDLQPAPLQVRDLQPAPLQPCS